ncbi:MAG: MarR family transcriptional regulator [Chloroflexia bacterium]|nr:MarR family transcriptional regulator [Chloroflexia bacterium]
MTQDDPGAKLRYMNYSAAELSTERSNLDTQVELCAGLLPVLARAMNCAILTLSQELEVTPAQVKVLLQLSRKEQMSVGEIADALYVSMPAASEIVDRLVDTGHVVRATDPADRRRVIVSATTESKQAIDRLADMRRTQLRKALLRLSPDERPVAVRTLEALIAELGGTDELPAALHRKAPRLT